MKVGILTFHRAINYGAVLQAYATQQVLISMGHDAYVINYLIPCVENSDRAPFLPNGKMNLFIHGHIRSWWLYDSNKCNTLKKRKLWDDFLAYRLRLTESCLQDSIPQDFDAYIIGSDQVWSSYICNGLDPVYWGNFKHPEDSRVIAYAASTSVTDMKKQSPDTLCGLMSNFNSISVRDEKVMSFINKELILNSNYSIPHAFLTIDPTILGGRNIWDTFTSKHSLPEKYILYFAARTYKPNPNAIREKAMQLADKFGCRVLSINFGEDSPEDFVVKIKNAEAVISSSFHGVAFSLIFNKPLFAIAYGDEQDSRYVNLLNNIGAQKMIHGIDEDLDPDIDFDYDKININIERLRTASLDYLTKSLNS
ncbi:MAG: polysaccharide pyruvyl transferase family protein [Bacteroidaceae bacterium]|nr:polysaccharide pyruvyl transferase family protein [Bacteroidaceae bacterium]